MEFFRQVKIELIWKTSNKFFLWISLDPKKLAGKNGSQWGATIDILNPPTRPEDISKFESSKFMENSWRLFPPKSNARCGSWVVNFEKHPAWPALKLVGTTLAASKGCWSCINGCGFSWELHAKCKLKLPKCFMQEEESSSVFGGRGID